MDDTVHVDFGLRSEPVSPQIDCCWIIQSHRINSGGDPVKSTLWSERPRSLATGGISMIQYPLDLRGIRAVGGQLLRGARWKRAASNRQSNSHCRNSCRWNEAAPIANAAEACVALGIVVKYPPSRLRQIHPLPGLIGIEQTDAIGEYFRAFTKILLIDSAGMIDHEGHDTRVSVFGRIGNQRETTDHLALDDVVKCASRCIWPLPPQYSKDVTVIRGALPINLIALR